MLIFYVFGGILLVFVLTLLMHRRFSSHPMKIGEAHCVLIIIAHPDDECMFFGPVICGLLHQGCDIHLLCLSVGGWRKGQTDVRKKELRLACHKLGINISQVTTVKHTKMPDDPYCLWNKRIVGDIILRYVEQLSIDTVISFDDYGISRHINHVAIAKALQNLYSRNQFPVGTQVLVLESVNLLRKYSGLLDLWFSRFSSTYCYVSGWSDIGLCQSAMCLHWSQMVWFRILYILFSRHMVINTLRRIAMEKHFYRYTKVK